MKKARKYERQEKRVHPQWIDLFFFEMICVPYTAESDGRSFHWRERERERERARKGARARACERKSQKGRAGGRDRGRERGREGERLGGREGEKDTDSQCFSTVVVDKKSVCASVETEKRKENW